MQFNSWEAGKNVNDGPIKMAKHIILNDADIVTMQEVATEEMAKEIHGALGAEWKMFYPYPSKVVTFSKHEIYNVSHTKLFCGHGVKIFVDEVNPIIVFNLQFDQAVFTAREIASNGFDEDLVELFEKNKKKPHSRYQNLKELLADEFLEESLHKVNVAPIIVAGDFHTPSHLDWIEATRKSHYNVVYEWPITSILSQQTALIDSYRFLHPNPLTDPGNTWSTVEKFIDGSDGEIQEPQERIDYIFYRGRHLTPIESYTYPKKFEGELLPYVQDNDWPSDHYAVVTTFQLAV
ncbi:unnamed protein product [Bursaphelenchus xylophilus]|uniref:(pine wood nematode) hypothetical protein n=1 Tax=Bursaphelenchus xylophilus TaxID=6326 RepID=A0A1I7S2N0_BURXY|nr:unnamed protein product [Bursaphelenchus xylophilus]CAG9121809.1 unnamed protein product [Bursaphelenchus xylophilus]